MNIRFGTVEDLPAIVEIYNSTVPSRMVTADTEPVSLESREGWFDAHDSESRPIWVAVSDEQVVGWLSFGDFYDGRPAYRTTVEVGVYVREDFRGQGVGRRLLQEAIDLSPKLGVETLTAGIFAHNTPSISLFENFGFERWAYFPRVARLDGVERDLVILGLRIEDRARPH